jgi:hypothetical protein
LRLANEAILSALLPPEVGSKFQNIFILVPAIIFVITSHNLLQVVKDDGADQLVNKVDCACVLAVEIDDLSSISRYQTPNPLSPCNDKKEKQIFLIYREIQSGAVAKSYMTNSLLIYD